MRLLRLLWAMIYSLFYSGVSYRHCLIMHHGVRGTEYTPPHDISGKVVGDYLPKGIYGDQMLDLMVKSYDVLKEHPINLKRIEEGKILQTAFGFGARAADLLFLTLQKQGGLKVL